MRRAALAFLAAAFLSSCAPWRPSRTPPRGDLAPAELPALGDDLPLDTLAAALDRSLAALWERPLTDRARFGEASCTIGELVTALEGFREALRTDGLEEAAASFRVLRSGGRPGGPLFTGYYEPILDARRSPSAEYAHPLYRRPEDLVEVRLRDFDPALAERRIHGRVVDGRLAPYHSRREIDEGALAGRGLELAWAADPVALFFLHVQGSGILRLEDGERLRVGYAATNGRPFTAIGRVLLDSGALRPGEASAPGIQRHLRERPETARDVLWANERYVFFREVTDGPIGSLGVKLTPGRSVAADPGAYPPGALAYVVTEVPVIDPDGRATGTKTIARFVTIQDAGAAITGPGRIDLFFGTGDAAGLEAGHMKAGGELYLLAPDCDPAA